MAAAGTAVSNAHGRNLRQGNLQGRGTGRSDTEDETGDDRGGDQPRGAGEIYHRIAARRKRNYLVYGPAHEELVEIYGRY